ncbi:MAG TPA: type VI secretion system tip protein TssI/VgrG [Polyangia bacterium]
MSENRPAKVTSPLGPEALELRRMTGHEELGRASFFELELLSNDGTIPLNKVLGKPMTVSLEVGEGTKRHFHGLVSRFSHVGNHGRYALYRATLRPWIWFLTRTANCRIFQKMTAPDVIKQVCKDHGFTDIEDALTGSYREWEYLVQYRETDFNFICRLLEQEGIYFYFKHEESVHKLVLADGYSAHQPAPGYDEIPWFPPDARAERERDYIDTINVSQNVQTGTFVIDDYDFERPKADLLAKLAAPKEHDHAELEVFDYPGEYVQGSDGEAYVRTRLEGIQAQYEQVQGRGNARGLAVGALFSLTQYPREDQNREYLVVAADYTLQNPEYESGSGSGVTFGVSFTAIDSTVQYRTPAATPKPEVRGPQTAIVVGPKGEEIWTDKYGRVKVQFHWDRVGANNENSSCWVRVAQVWAGSKWGGIHIPRIGQEVIVDFLEGDPDRPIITGRVYNADNMPPYDLPGNATQSGIKSRSSKGGGPANFNEIRFEDKKGAEELYIHAEKTQTIIVEASESHSVGVDRSKSIGNNETVSVGVDRTETVGSNETISIGVDRTETVGSNETISIGANRTETVGANESVTVGGSRTMSIGAAETLSVGAKRTKSIGGAENVSIGGLRMTKIGAAEQLTVTAARNTSVGASDSLEVAGNISVNAGGNHSTNVGGNSSVTAGKNHTVKAGASITIDAADQITLKTGSASLTMKKDGKIVLKGKEITIDGKDITVKGSGKISIKASSDVVIKGSKVGNN